MRCRKFDCFSCKRSDCTNNYIKPLKPQTEEQSAKDAKRRAALKVDRENRGLCTNCGKRPPKDGFRMCEICQSKYRKYKEQQNRRKGVTPKQMMDGVKVCAKCGKDKPVNGYKLCDRCLRNNLEFLSRTPTHNGRKQTGGFADGNKAFWANKKQKPGV